MPADPLLAPIIASALRDGRFQSLASLSAQRTPETILMTVGLGLPGVPTIELFSHVTGDRALDLVPANLIAVRFPFLAGVAPSHRVRFPGLRPGTLHWYRITLPPGPLQLRPIVRTGLIATLDRRLVIDIVQIRVLMDGDEQSEGEITFHLDAIDGAERRHLLPGRSTAQLEISDGDRIAAPFGQPLVIEHAPQAVLLGVVAQEDDEWDFGGLNLSLPENDWPYRHGAAVWEDDDNTYASALHGLSLPGEIGSSSGGFRMDSPLAALHFEVFGGWTAEVTDPHPFIGKARRLPSVRSLTLASGGTARFRGRRALHLDGKGQILAIRPESLPVVLDERSFQQLLIHPREGGTVDLVSLGDDRRLRHAVVAMNEATELEWTDLPAHAQALPESLRGRDGRLHLASIDEEGRLGHGVAGASVPWTLIEGHFAGAPCWADPVDAPPYLAAASADGDTITVGPIEGGDPMIAVALNGHRLLGLTADLVGNVVILALDQDDLVWSRDLDHDHGWEPLAPIDELLEPMPA